VRLAQCDREKISGRSRARLKVTNEPARGNILSGYPGSIGIAIARKFSVGAERQSA
jgi:hypothetical protein